MDSSTAKQSIPVLKSIDQFQTWKEEILSYFRFTDYTMINCINLGPHCPMSVGEDNAVRPNAVPSTYTEDDRKQLARDAKTLGALELALVPELRRSFKQYKNGKELWDAIQERFEGNHELKNNKLTMLKKQYERFQWQRDETVKQLMMRFSTLVNQIGA